MNSGAMITEISALRIDTGIEDEYTERFYRMGLKAAIKVIEKEVGEIEKEGMKMLLNRLIRKVSKEQAEYILAESSDMLSWNERFVIEDDEVVIKWMS